MTVERSLSEKRIRELQRIHDDLEKLQDPETTITMSTNVLSRLLGMSMPVLYRDYIRDGFITLREDPNNPKLKLITGAEFQCFQVIIKARNGSRRL